MSRAGLGLTLFTFGCSHPLPPDQYCKEAAWAIAGRTQECTGDVALAEARYAQFFEDYACVEFDIQDYDSAPIAYENLFHCPLAIRALPCELVDSYADDLSLWMTASPVCRVLVEPT